MIFLYILVLIVGFVGLVKGADLFVDGSAKIAGNLGVSGLIIGLTIVALGIFWEFWDSARSSLLCLLIRAH